MNERVVRHHSFHSCQTEQCVPVSE